MADDDTKSVGSKISKSSKTSKFSVGSVMSRASSLGASLRRTFTGSSRATTRSVSELIDLQPGQVCETVALVTMREDETLESARVGDIPAGQLLEVLEVGEGRRLKIKTSAGTVGWVSTKTKMNEVLIMKRVQEVEAALQGWEVGGQHEVKFKVTLRAGEGLDSSVLGELAPGSVFTIRELGSENSRRALVQTAQVTGWISLVTKQGELLAGKLSSKEKDRPTGMFGSSSVKIREMLEAARAGDLEKLQKILDPPSIMSKLSGRPNINMSDIRGRNALIYAASGGHLEVLQYLLSKTGEIDVNGMDDTEKTALHYAAKREVSASQDESRMVQVVNTLLVCKAHIEARDHNGCTPLIFAVANGNETVTKALMLANANLNAADTEQHSCLSYAKQFGHQRILSMLEKAGARETLCLEEDDGDDDVAPLSPTSAVLPASPASHGYPSSVAESSAPQNQSATFDSLSTTATDSGSAATLSVAAVVSEEASGEAASVPKKKKSVVKKKTKTEVAEASETPEPADAEAAAAADASEAAVPAAVVKKKKSVVKAKEGEDGEAKKTVKKKKTTSGGKGMTAAMMEAVAGDGLTVAVAGDAVGADTKAHALEKLSAVMESTTSPKELKKCIETAQAQGATDTDLADANEKLKTLKAANAKKKAAKEAKQSLASAEAVSGEAS